MAEEQRPGGGWLPPSDREYTPSDGPGAARPAAAAGAAGGDAAPALGGWPAPAGAGHGTWPPGDGYQAATGPEPAPGGSNGKATASLVFGIVGLLVCPVVCSVVAIVLGHRARREIAASAVRQNRGVATAGIVLGWIGIAIALLGLLFFLFVALVADGPVTSEGDGDGFDAQPSVVLGAQVLARATGLA
jgi:hypothetical protein